MRKVVLDNDAEMRRQIENATKKIQKYKQIVQEKQAEVDDLNQKILAAQEEGQEEEEVEEVKQQQLPPVNAAITSPTQT